MTDIDLLALQAWAGEVAKGRSLRLISNAGVSLVAFNRADVRERFDQARTKVYNMRLWLEPGSQLFSKLNNPMFTVVEDGFAAYGRHDLQLGHALGDASRAGAALEAIAGVLAPRGIAWHEIPMPLNAFQHADVNTATGQVAATDVRAPEQVVLVLRAEMDLVVAMAACPRPGVRESARLEIEEA